MLPFLPKQNPRDLAINLHLAVRQSRGDEVLRLIRQGANPHLIVAPEWANYSGNAYHAFAAIHHKDYVEQDRAVMAELARHRININAQNERGETPLHLAAKVEDKAAASAEIIAVLIAAGADVLTSTREGWNALHLICRDDKSLPASSVACAEALIKGGAPLDARGNGGASALMCAARAGLDDVCALLAHSGANIHLRDTSGLRASDYARVGGHHMLADQLQMREETEPETKPSFDSTVVPKVQWDKLSEDRISRTTIEDPIRYQLTEIFNFRSRLYTCITKNLYTKVEAVSVQSFDTLGDSEVLDLAARVLERKGGRAESKPRPAAPRRIEKLDPK